MSQITAKIISDSVSETTGTRITTMELSYHRFIHSEFMTHRVFSRNASSSRAIPVDTLLKQVRNDPMMPLYWGSNKPGMQAGEELSGDELHIVQSEWLNAARIAADAAEQLKEQGLHKQIANRLLEPFLPIKVIVTATEWDNFFALRDHRDAQPEIQELAHCMKKAMDESEPDVLYPGDWHLPYVTKTELYQWVEDLGDVNIALELALKVSSARCARVSFLNHDGTKPLINKDVDLFNMLVKRPYTDGKGNTFADDDPIHASPTEHQATPMKVHGWSGNFRNWKQFRQTL